VGLTSSPLLLADETSAAEAVDTGAGEQDYEALGARLINYGQSLEGIANDFESNRVRMRNELDRLQNLVDRKEIDITRAINDAEALEEKILLGQDLQSQLNDKYQQINHNFRKFAFKTRAQKLIPFLYAGAAMLLIDGNLGDKAIYGLAGYGAGSLIENTGYGLAGGITWLRYERSF